MKRRAALPSDSFRNNNARHICSRRSCTLRQFVEGVKVWSRATRIIHETPRIVNMSISETRSSGQATTLERDRSGLIVRGRERERSFVRTSRWTSSLRGERTGSDYSCEYVSKREESGAPGESRFPPPLLPLPPLGRIPPGGRRDEL
jgi:hypothetical protein